MLTVERAYSGETFIGWRLAIGKDTFLVWQDQQRMEGFRCGREFVPSMGETIRYVSCNVVEAKSVSSAG